MQGQPLLRRAQRSAAISAFAPVILFVGYQVWSRVRDNTLEGDLLLVAALTLLVGLAGLVPYVMTRKVPSAWLYVGYAGALAIVIVVVRAVSIAEENESLVAGVVVVVIAAIALLPMLLARKTVLADLSTDLAGTDMILILHPRKSNFGAFAVYPDRVSLSGHTSSRERFFVEAPMTDVSEVTTWTETGASVWAVPGDGDQTTDVPAGELLGIAVPDGQLVVALAEPNKVRRFVEARVAAAG